MCSKKHVVFCWMLFLSFIATAQTPGYQIFKFSLPEPVAYFNHQFSSLNIYKKQLLLMAESRLLEPGQKAEVFCVKLKDLEKQMADASYALPYKKIPIVGLDSILHRLYRQGFVAEGLEAMVIHNRDVYFSVETKTETPYDYLLKGSMKKERIVLDTGKVIPIWKPRFPNGEAVYNASFECMEWYNNRLFIFHEYNYFSQGNWVFSFDKTLDLVTKDSFPIDRMPYRISDIKSIGNDEFAAINLFYKGGGRDTVNRPEAADTVNYKQVYRNNRFENFTRLVRLRFDGNKFSWEPFFDLPQEYNGFNWEGIAAYKKGFFLANDKFTPTMPYYSILLYVKLL